MTPGGRRLRPSLPLVLGTLLAGLLLLRPVAYGIPLAVVAAFWLLVVVTSLPGVLICRAAGLYRGDRLLLLGQGCTLGIALQGLSFVGSHAVGRPWVAGVVPLLAAATALVWLRRGRGGSLGGQHLGSAPGLLAAIMMVACLLQPLFSLRLLGDPVPVDLLFHAGNAGELRHRWPLEDPRVSGLPLNYHILSYALPAATSQWIGLPVGDALLALAPLFWIALLVLQLQNAGRLLFGDRVAGVLGAAVAVLHTDPGRILGLGPGAFSSYFSTGLYGSPTTVAGLVLLASLAISLFEVLATASLRLVSLVTLVPLAVAAAATKATVVPPILGGLGLVAIFSRSPEGGRRRAAMGAGLILGLCALPFLWGYTTGDSSYRSVLRWGPGAVIWQSAFATEATQLLARLGLAAGGTMPGQLPIGLLLLILAAWVVGYLALGGAGTAAFLWLRGRSLSPPQFWALGVAAWGAAAGLLLEGQGLSQLFFFYDGQALLALFAGAGIVLVSREWRRHPWLVVALACFTIPSLHLALGALTAGLSHDIEAQGRTYSGFAGSYAGGLAWLRGNATEHTVIFADNPSFLLSAFGECPTFYESGLYTPEGWRKRWEGTEEPYPERVLLQERLLRRPDRESAAAAQGLFPPGTAIRIVADNVQSRIHGGTLEVSLGQVPGRLLFPPELFRLEFANAAMHVYRLETTP